MNWMMPASAPLQRLCPLPCPSLSFHCFISVTGACFFFSFRVEAHGFGLPGFASHRSGLHGCLRQPTSTSQAVVNVIYCTFETSCSSSSSILRIPKIMVCWNTKDEVCLHLWCLSWERNCMVCFSWQTVHSCLFVCMSACLGTVHDIVNRGGRCLIPVFALGRAQELLLILGMYLLAYWCWTLYVFDT